MDISPVCAVVIQYVECNDLFLCLPGLVDVCAMTYTFVFIDSFMCAANLIHMCAIYIYIYIYI